VATVPSVRCRLLALTDATMADVPAGPVRAALLRAAERALRRAEHQLRVYEHRIASLAGRRAIDDQTRSTLTALARALRTDLRSMSAGMCSLIQTRVVARRSVDGVQQSR
jgi:hypothetical protein